MSIRGLISNDLRRTLLTKQSACHFLSICTVVIFEQLSFRKICMSNHLHFGQSAFWTICILDNPTLTRKKRVALIRLHLDRFFSDKRFKSSFKVGFDFFRLWGVWSNLPSAYLKSANYYELPKTYFSKYLRSAILLWYSKDQTCGALMSQGVDIFFRYSCFTCFFNSIYDFVHFKNSAAHQVTKDETILTIFWRDSLI